LHLGGHRQGHRRRLLQIPGRARRGQGEGGRVGLMLTVDYERLGVRPGDRLLDLGCGGGRHAFEAYRRGAHVVAYDRDRLELKEATAILGAMEDAGDVPEGTAGTAAVGDALALPFPDAAF